MFTQLGLIFDTPATGEVWCRVGVEVSMGDAAELVEVVEVQPDRDGPWVTWMELQDQGLRTLAAEMVLATQRELEDPELQDRLCRQADEEAAEPWGGDYD